MKRYRGVVVFRYYQEIEVEAETQDDAERIMCEEFRLDKADGECEVYDMEEMTVVQGRLVVMQLTIKDKLKTEET